MRDLLPRDTEVSSAGSNNSQVWDREVSEGVRDLLPRDTEVSSVGSINS